MERTRKRLSTLVNDKVGKEAPKKKPKTIPAKVVKISLIVSFVLPIFPLHPESKSIICKYIAALKNKILVNQLRALRHLLVTESTS